MTTSLPGLLAHVTEAFKLTQPGRQPIPEITVETRLDEDLGLDSLEIVELAITFEELVGKKLPNDVVDEARTVGDLIRPLTLWPTEEPKS